MNTSNPTSPSIESTCSRRHFLQGSSIALAGAALAEFPFVLAARAEADMPIRIGVIGCGGRGTGAVLDALGAATQVIYPSAGYHTEDVASNATVAHKNLEVVALCDVFMDRVNACRQNLKKLGVNVPDAMCFDGFDGYKKLLEIPEINYVIHATLPHFRPLHVKAAVEAGKNVFMEKPGAVDGPGVRTLLEAGEIAKAKNLGIAAGTQRRHRPSYNEAIRRIHDGQIGEIQCLRCYWNGGVIWVIEKTDAMSDMEWQLRNWNYFTWTSGDHIVEQHVHNLDIMNWAMGAHPVKAYGQGGRQARRHPIHGNIYDHFAVEFEYPNGVRMFSQCRQMDGTEGRVGEVIQATQGVATLNDGNNLLTIRGGGNWRSRGLEDGNPYQKEHQNLIASIRAGKPINEAKSLAESTLTAIMGRESAYTGRTVEWDEALHSKLRYGPDTYELGSLPFPEVPVPGKHKFA
ncbi:MAG TPA: Gfo/Idh/MocA family oxidoreductase [Verrucomicrobiota bacterium]|jgi:predicted dehydrogenase|nr:Gfo/Idh/MocA family oxidoreductase [Verrucomicrobiota bacterium]NMD20520.1 Gfo/Idh/MocA family oxidoreductase [Verrucomicrobiota bacterium]HNU99803.1 Gfo/Idh/MocA family oxidoreductase [Verrucomicrobiota bacterium]HOA61293.1 Gfo/Idh/MocA family oxidoreductase [Verrucomicrobiota bacterium]HOF48966.1 Gfo/Idh/MocA family oxidoreductase [Verrucomicrobiota bacterium]